MGTKENLNASPSSIDPFLDGSQGTGLSVLMSGLQYVEGAMNNGPLSVWRWAWIGSMWKEQRT